MHAHARLTLVSRLSFGPMRVGNLPALFKPGPSSRGICLMTESDAKKAEYFFAAHGAQLAHISRSHISRLFLPLPNHACSVACSHHSSHNLL